MSHALHQTMMYYKVENLIETISLGETIPPETMSLKTLLFDEIINVVNLPPPKQRVSSP